MPQAGDSVEADGFRLTAVDVRGRRIGRVRIEPTGARTAEATTDARTGAGGDGHGGVSHHGS